MTKTTVRFKFSLIVLLAVSLPAFSQPLNQDPDLLYQQGKRFREENRYEQAFEQWGSALQRDPEHTQTLIALTELNYFLGKFKDCLTYGEKALKQAPENPDLYLYVGAVLSYVGRVEDAFDVLKKGAALDPKRTDFLFHLAEIEIASSHFSEGRKWAQKILKKEPAQPHAAYLIGVTWAEEGKKKKGRRWLKKALSWDPRFSPALFSLGLLDLEEGKKERAQSQFEKVAQLDRVHPKAFFYLALLEGEKGNLFRQYYWFKRAAVYFPKESEEKGQIEKGMSEIEKKFSLTENQMKHFVQYDLPIQVGDSIQKVEKNLGQPEYKNPLATLFLYPSRSLTLQFEKGKLSQIQVDSPFQGKIHGASMGNKLQDLERIYGPPQQLEADEVTYNFQNEYVTFSLDEGKIHRCNIKMK